MVDRLAASLAKLNSFTRPIRNGGSLEETESAFALLMISSLASIFNLLKKMALVLLCDIYQSQRYSASRFASSS